MMRVRTHQWPWFAILVRTGEEKRATLLLENAGYECFLPLTSTDDQFSARASGIALPLFPGYLFCRMNPYNRVPVLMTPGVIQIVGVGKMSIAVDEAEIAAIQLAGKSDLSTIPWPYLRAGIVERIEDVPLRGLRGIVVKLKFGMKLLLSVSLLERSMAVEIHPGWIGSSHSTRPGTSHAHLCRPAPPTLDVNRLETTPGRQ